VANAADSPTMPPIPRMSQETVVLRKVLTLFLAVPVVAIVVAGSLIRRVSGRRPILGLTALLGIALAAAAIGAGASRPSAATGISPTHESPLPAAAFVTRIETGASPVAAITMTFPVPMNQRSVEALLGIEPATAVDLGWDSASKTLTVTPRTAWMTGVLNTITVEDGALEASGRPLDQRIRASFATRAATSATITPTVGTADAAGITTAFRIAFSGPVDGSTLDVRITPEVAGTLGPAVDSMTAAPIFEFKPAAPLDPDAAYSVALAPGARDAEGAPISAARLAVRTGVAPAVIRFRPRDGATDTARDAALSVRFTTPMDHATTEAAWSAAQAGAPIAGTFAWAENDTVMVFQPASLLGYAEKVTMAVGVGALSRAGVPLTTSASATFTSARRPPTPAKPSNAGSGSGSGTSGGAAANVGAGTWAAVESYYLGLMNCTRTGGLVTSTGACSSPGGRIVALLWQDEGISAGVSRPYAKKLVLGNLCTHYSGGTPGDRLEAAGYTSYNWAENLGCLGGDPFKAALGDHLFFQGEASRNGGHYVNLMNAKYDRVGIGVWASGGRVRLVVDFYHPR
jgi:uncharacterized protein YkwD